MRIVQYGHYDGIPTMRDSEVMDLYRRMVEDGTSDIVFHDGIVSSPKKFLEFAKTVIMAVAVEGNEPLGVGWLTNVEKKRAFGHFCLFSKGWGKQSKEIGRTLVSYLSNLKIDGEHMFDVLIGLTPSLNYRAVEFSKECGGIVVGEIPKALYNAYTNESMDATVIYYLRR